jgi:predicted SAM-dependent methyltransferase
MTTSRRRAVHLHLGCGNKRLEGWVNVDSKLLPEVDVVADVADGLAFRRADAILAEHFLEHLEIAEALQFLREAHRVLSDDGWLRLSTPDLEWVWSTHYRTDRDSTEREKQLMAIRTNRAFHGWGHRFLWNRELIREALGACGFESIRWRRYGESDMTPFDAVERHSPDGDVAALAHAIIVEARKGEFDGERLFAFESLLATEFHAHMAG